MKLGKGISYDRLKLGASQSIGYRFVSNMNGTMQAANGSTYTVESTESSTTPGRCDAVHGRK
jgi:hypothetical protein